MKYLLIQNNIVENIVIADPELIGDLFPFYVVEEYQDGVGIGWIKTESGYGPPNQPEPEPQPVPPNWPAFNFYLFSDTTFIERGQAIQSMNPYLVPALIERYGQVAKIGLEQSDFASYWNYFCQLADVDLPEREIWATTAEFFNLPADFIAAVRGA